ncbi:MAG: glycosyltransferase family 2 protein [Solirubrobacterales bacterium]|nr:glycosyltransferase family 2 protein [Solirubrobacterales bacterium]
MKPRPDLSVVIVTHNGRDLALATIASAKAATGDLEAEWLVSDAGSQDGTPEAIEAAHPDVLVLRGPNRGFAAGNNAALRVASGRYVLLLNPDTEVARGTFEELVRALDERPDVGIASVVQQWPDGRLQPSIRHVPTVRRQLADALGLHRLGRKGGEVVTDPEAYARETAADWLVGAFLIARHEAMDDVGLMDDRFFLYSEEKDWCVRFKAAGWDVRHLPVMAITHHAGGFARPMMVAQLTYAKLQYFEKHHGRAAAGALRLSLGLHHALRLLAFGVLRRQPPAEVGGGEQLAGVRPDPRTRVEGERLGLRVCFTGYVPQLGATPREPSATEPAVAGR